MRNSPVNIRATGKVSDAVLISACGISVAPPPAAALAAPAMVLRLKLTPVSVTPLITLTTAAVAAPTASAFQRRSKCCRSAPGWRRGPAR